jgi:hypothetical protein
VAVLGGLRVGDRVPARAAGVRLLCAWVLLSGGARVVTAERWALRTPAAPLASWGYCSSTVRFVSVDSLALYARVLCYFVSIRAFTMRIALLCCPPSTSSAGIACAVLEVGWGLLYSTWEPPACGVNLPALRGRGSRRVGARARPDDVIVAGQEAPCTLYLTLTQCESIAGTESTTNQP